MLHLTGFVKTKTVDKLIDAIDKCTEKGINTLSVYINSEGGDAESMEALIHIINEHFSLITLIAYGSIQSAAFIVFFKVVCKRIILPGTQGMFHYARISIEVGSKTDGYYKCDKANQEWIDFENKQYYKFCKKLGFTAKELNDLKKTEEVYFTTARLNELLEYQNAG